MEEMEEDRLHRVKHREEMEDLDWWYCNIIRKFLHLCKKQNGIKKESPVNIMPPFRIHQTRVRPERILIRLLQGRYVIPSQVPVIVPAVASPVEEKVEKKQTTITLKQIKDIIILLQKSDHKNLDKLLPEDLKALLTLDEDKVDDVDESEVHDSIPDLPEDDDDILIIDV